MLLCGCSLFGPRVGLDTLTLDVAPRANDDTPIAVDFVAVKDADLLKQLSGMSARQWFAEREQFQRDYRQMMSVWGLELVPGQFIGDQRFPLGGERAAGLLVFASYNTPGAHRLRLDDQSSAWLKFNSREMTLLSADTH
ncbi:type VI secretion protein [Pseudomonas chlororaphis subsp. aurantiaca PB-St2]|nr:type VI secretion protein [Pseudomonas chlororaphis subsp. aurantiaca PB-St2]